MPKSQQKVQPAELLGDYVVPRASFPNPASIIAEFQTEEFKQLSRRKRFHAVNERLLKLILDAPKEAFLLPAVIEYMDHVNKQEVLHEPLHINVFEFWLNQFSGLNDTENYLVRGKIMGKYIARDDYQNLFPIGMEKVFNGTHFVVAHLSPDVDTMVASFWGWVDAFAARVGDARHIWCLPGGPPDSPVTQIFRDLFGPSVFEHVAQFNPALALNATDLITQKGFVKKSGKMSISAFDLSSGDKAVILVDDKGHFLGDWHSADVEPIRKIIIRFKSCLRWFETNLHAQLISLFAKPKLHVKDLPPFFSSIFDVAIQDCEPAKEFTERQKKDLNDFFIKVIGLKKGLASTFRELNEALAELSVLEMRQLQIEVETLSKSGLFDSSGYLIEERPAIFHRLEKIIQDLDKAIHHARDYGEQLDVALHIKHRVLGIPPQYVTLRNDVEEIRIKMKRQEYITVVISEEGGRLFPIGIVTMQTLQKQTLGTVSFRDFCNLEEVRMSSYLTPISVIDHHKSSLKTSAPPLAIISDAQSSNVLVAEEAFAINAGYSLGGMTLATINEEISKNQSKSSASSARLIQGLLQRRIAAETAGNHFVSIDRELAEYICFLHAILDDTDLMTKVSKRDVECIVKLLNQIKSLTIRRDVEIIDLDDLNRDKEFAKAAAKRILRNPEMYSFYRKIFESKEQEVEKSLKECLKSHCELLFVDTKEQNGCCRVGQTKLFTQNVPTFLKNSHLLQNYWYEASREVYKEHPEIDLYLHMISTIPSASEVYEDKVGHYEHQDQLWFWVPPTSKADDHLSSFLTAFQAAHKLAPPARLEFLSSTPEEVQQLFTRSFSALPCSKRSSGPKLPLAILYFSAGLLNSRKAMITPYLPRLV